MGKHVMKHDDIFVDVLCVQRAAKGRQGLGGCSVSFLSHISQTVVTLSRHVTLTVTLVLVAHAFRPQFCTPALSDS